MSEVTTVNPVARADRNRRILVIDDNIAIHEDIRKILCPPVSQASASLDALEAELLGAASSGSVRGPTFQVDSAYQGREGLALVQRAKADGRPYAMAFVDVRMPPGWDGIQTTKALWEVEPDLQIVICTAYSDYSWEEMLDSLGRNDRLVILRKPFDTIEVLQLANAFTEKWNLVQDARRHAEELEERVRARTTDLETANRALQAEIERRVTVEADLVRARDAAETADRAKSAFLANMSHEIRTPMNGVVGMANLLQSTPLNPEQGDYVQTLSHCCDSLLTIINDILDFSKIEAGRLELEIADFDLAETIQVAVDLQADVAARKSLELILDIDPAVPAIVSGDSVRLRQVLLNLITNAVKFTESGEVVVRVASAPASSPNRAKLRFEITDSGVGIAAHVQPTLFQPFVQADSSTTRRFGGTGLGLAISKRLVELMRGEIGVVSEPGRGSTFWFTVELDAPAVTDANITFLPLPLEGRSILVVDDSEANRFFLQRLLERWGARPRVIDAADAALAELRRAARAGSPYPIVLLDHQMPGTDGLQLASAISADPILQKPVLILMSSQGARLTPAQLTNHGLDACELKPINPDKLRAAVGHALTQHRRPEPRPEPDAAPRPKLHREQVLVAEDNLVNQKVIILMLRNLGYGCRVVENGREALAALREQGFGMILMDEHMPEMDGITATREIRRQAALGMLKVPVDVPIVATTADAMPGTRERCLEAGMDDYLAKPLRIEALGEMIANHLSRRADATRKLVVGN